MALSNTGDFDNDGDFDIALSWRNRVIAFDSSGITFNQTVSSSGTNIQALFTPAIYNINSGSTREIIVAYTRFNTPNVRNFIKSFNADGTDTFTDAEITPVSNENYKISNFFIMDVANPYPYVGWSYDVADIGVFYTNGVSLDSLHARFFNYNGAAIYTMDCGTPSMWKTVANWQYMVSGENPKIARVGNNWDVFTSFAHLDFWTGGFSGTCRLIESFDKHTLAYTSFAPTGENEFFMSALPVDIDDDGNGEILVSTNYTFTIYESQTQNANPYYIENPVADTCMPLCVNSTVTFAARKNVEYVDAEGSDVFLAADCFNNGSLTYSPLSQNPQVGCLYANLGTWTPIIHITDLANYYNQSSWDSVTFEVYTSIGNCYQSGQVDLNCLPFSTTPTITNQTGISDSGFNLTAIKQITNPDLPANQTDNYHAVYYDWSRCNDWTFFRGLCPLWNYGTYSLNEIWTWIFGFFWLFLVLILVILVLAILFKQKIINQR